MSRVCCTSATPGEGRSEQTEAAWWGRRAAPRTHAARLAASSDLRCIVPCLCSHNMHVTQRS